MALALQDATKGECIVASPCRWDASHPLAQHFMEGAGHRFDRQLEWERYYITQAATEWPYGCVLFWLGTQQEPRAKAAGPYAQDTYGELGELRGRMIYEKRIRIVIGAESEFPGIDVIQRNFAHALKQRSYQLFSHIDDTAKAAVRRSKQ